jgi:hypothetical protein
MEKAVLRIRAAIDKKDSAPMIPKTSPQSITNPDPAAT